METGHYLNLAGMSPETEAEGPGRRIALWVQGCLRRCPGCCNPDMQPIREACMVETGDLIRVLERIRESHDVEGVTFIGG